MSANKIVTSQFIKNVTKGGKTIAAEYATKTDTWDRTFLAKSVQEDFTKALEKAEVPTHAVKAILAEKEHPSTSDGKDHFTTVYRDANGNHITTRHVYR